MQQKGSKTLRYMRTFYEEWSCLDADYNKDETENRNLAPAGAELENDGNN